MAAPATPEAVSQARADLRAKRRTLVAAIDAEAKAAAMLDTLVRQVVETTAPDNAVKVARDELTRLQGELTAARTAEATSRTALAGAIATWLKDGANLVTPDVDIARLQVAHPLVLFPARMETRFDLPGGRLRVRVYPDEISIDTHERALTPSEREAGVNYYQGRRLGDTAAEKERWKALVGSFGAPRAAYIARVMRPVLEQDGPYPVYSSCSTDWENEIPPQLQFEPVPGRPDAWTRPAEALQPDRWVLVGFRGGRQVLLKAGNPIPEPLVVTPDPGGNEVTVDGFEMHDDLRWTIDYARAETLGMAITVTAADDAGFAAGYDRLVAIGVKSSLPPVEPFVPQEPAWTPLFPPVDAATYLEQLFDAHHYTRGLAIVPQGTPTNNTAGSPTSFPPEDDFGAQSFEVERDPPPFHRTISYHCPTEPDVDALARTLGVPSGVFQNVFGAKLAREQLRAALMNLAVWPATWGYFLEHMMWPVLKDERATINDTARPYFGRYVRGRGPAPAFRVGGVPYGVLPAVSLGRWQRTDTLPESLLEEALVKRFRILRELWKNTARAKAPRAALGSGAPYQPLLNVLAQEASGRQVRVRNRRSKDSFLNLLRLFGEDVAGVLAAMTANTGTVLDLISEKGWLLARVMGLDLDPQSDVFPESLVMLKDGKPPAQYIAELPAFTRAAFDSLRDDTTIIPGAKKPLLYKLLRHALLLEYARIARDPAVGVLPPREYELFGFTLPIEDRPFWDTVSPAFEPQIAFRAFDYHDVLSVPPNSESDAVGLAQALTGVPNEEVERLFTEALDVSSHRLDAWITALATRRLESLRALHDRGGYVGGYAWVENLRPLRTSASNGGFIHAPSMPQAAAAAVLRSAHQTGSLEVAQKYAIDLSSERVRIGRRVLDEIREGQPLGAVMGYRLERALKDRHPGIGIERFIFALRNLYPLVANKSKTEAPGVAAEAIAARNVVDGVVVLGKHKANAIPFGTAGLPDPNGTAADRAAHAAIVAELDALDGINDAVADLVNAESVYQLVRGNVAAASATMDALARGLRPPDPEIARSPRAGVGVTHRIAVAWRGDLSEPAGWTPEPANGFQPRVSHALDLDRFLGQLMGDASKVKATVTYEDAQGDSQSVDVFLGPPTGGARSLKLRPLDVIAIARAATTANEGSLLDRYLLDAALAGVSGFAEPRVAYATSTDPTVLDFPQIMELARALGAAFAGVRPLSADHLAPPAEAADAGDGLVDADAQTFFDRAGDALEELKEFRFQLDQAIADEEEADLEALLRDKLPTYDPSALPPPGASTAQLFALGAAKSADLGPRVVAGERERDGAGTGAADKLRAATAIYQAVFGADYVPPMPFSPRNAGEIAQSLGARAQLLPAAGDEAAPAQMLAQAARVREPLARGRRVALYLGAAERALPHIELVQVPFLPGEAWAGPRKTTAPVPRGRVSCLLLVPDGASLTGAAAAKLQGLLVDDWVETVPADKEDTGIAFHYDNPGAEAPQAVLVAVPAAADRKWTWRQLLATVDETMDLAQIRVVEPQDLPLQQALPAIYLSHNVDNVTVSTDFPELAKDPIIVE
jgi:hypothetical protein